MYFSNYKGIYIIVVVSFSTANPKIGMEVHTWYQVVFEQPCFFPSNLQAFHQVSCLPEDQHYDWAWVWVWVLDEHLDPSYLGVFKYTNPIWP